MLLFAVLAACGSSLIPPSVAGPLGTDLCAVGHPNAECGEGRVTGTSHGPLAFKEPKERWIDLAVPYTRKDKAHEMTIRLYVKNVSPCKIKVDVIADDGPNPVLLDNAVTGSLAGQAICSHLGG